MGLTGHRTAIGGYIKAVKALPYYGRKLPMAFVLSRFSALWHFINVGTVKHSKREFESLFDRLWTLYKSDVQQADAGYYSLAFASQFPLRDFLSYAPRMPKEFFRIYRRRQRREYDDIPQDIAREYPRYYQRTFHWQSDGWLSKRSAELYDPGVEFLFGGTADIMRRMLIPGVFDALKQDPEPTLLDVACGTGRFIKQLAQLKPHLPLTGVDLSPFYVEHARAQCQSAQTTFREANAESLPFPDNTFSVVTCIYLFHELPKDVRRRVMGELVRVTKPGGVVAVLDSEQLVRGDDISSFLTQFPKVYHEPYYLSYLRDDLGDVMTTAGLETIDQRAHFVSRSFLGRKPRNVFVNEL